MKLVISKKADINYLAKIVKIDSFSPHPNPEVTKMKIAHIEGFSICVGIDEEPGLYVYFPTLSQINPNLLYFLNLYSDKELNRNPEAKTGFFSKNGRVKAIRLKGSLSEGFLLPFEHLQSWLIDTVNTELPIQKNGLEFDSVEHNDKTFWISRKYIIHPTRTPGMGGSKNSRHDKKLKKFDRIIENQFRFHYDTVLLKKCPNIIHPTDLIHISSKWHGTSGISAYVLCHQPLNWRQRLAKLLTGEAFDKYDYIYSSRSVIKNKYINKDVGDGFYGCDVWAEADKFLRPFLEKGMTLYYEIVGYLPNCNYIQKGYDYGCIPPVGQDYKEGLNFKVYIYRITTTNIDGKVHEWSTQEVQTWCKNQGLRPVIQLYYGRAMDLYPEILHIKDENTENPFIDNDWSTKFLEKLANDKAFFMEEDSPDCRNKVPHEGIVIKIEDMIPRAFKLKSFAFLNKEQKEADEGVSNIEDNA